MIKLKFGRVCTRYSQKSGKRKCLSHRILATVIETRGGRSRVLAQKLVPEKFKRIKRRK